MESALSQSNRVAYIEPGRGPISTVCSVNLMCCDLFPLSFSIFYFMYASMPHVTIPIYTPSLVSLFTDEGSRRLPKHLIYFLLISLVCCKTINCAYIVLHRCSHKVLA